MVQKTTIVGAASNAVVDCTFFGTKAGDVVWVVGVTKADAEVARDAITQADLINCTIVIAFLSEEGRNLRFLWLGWEPTFSSVTCN